MPDIFRTRRQPNQPQEEPPPAESAPVAQHPHVSHPIGPDSDARESIEKLMHSHHQPMGLFATFAKHPKGITFANQEPDEIILLFLRRHFITNIPWLLATFFFLLLPPVLLLLLSAIPDFILPLGLTIVLTGFYYLIIIGYAFGKFISWFYNIGVVTQKRIIDLNSANILAHNTATANFGEIVDVKFIQRGFFQSTFDYGDIHIQTEALRANFDFDAAPKPTEVTDIISDLRVAMKGAPHGTS
jgi:hypothetical protein